MDVSALLVFLHTSYFILQTRSLELVNSCASYVRFVSFLVIFHFIFDIFVLSLLSSFAGLLLLMIIQMSACPILLRSDLPIFVCKTLISRSC